MKNQQLFFVASIIVAMTLTQCVRSQKKQENDEVVLKLVQNIPEGTIAVFREGGNDLLLTQNAKPDFRPYLHPILAPDGKGVVTQNSPGHHKHQTGIYWGYTRLNGRDYFHNPQGDHWRRVSVTVVEENGTEVKWQTVYELLGDVGNVVLVETQNWSMREANGKFFLDVEWNGEAKADVTVSKYDYGGLFIRMPWRKEVNGEVVNAARQRNERAEGQQSMWIDVGMQVEGRDDFAHIAVFDHPDNNGFPQTWRVDGQLGVGHARSRNGDWNIKSGDTEVIRQHLVIYTGELDDTAMTEAYNNFTGNHSMYSTAVLWKIAQQEGREAKFLTPEEAVANMTLVKGYKVNAWASEPMMTQPMAFCWDDRGRLWVAENRDYESRGHGFSNSGDSRILILEDTNGDGMADSQKVFMDGIAFPAALAVGMGGVFVGAPPNLLFIPDRDEDDKADVADIEIRLTGWGIRDRHETLNSLHWGPDGWLYGLQGFATPSRIKKPEGKGKLYAHREAFPENILEGEGVDINGGVWRYHPTKDIFEVVAHGFSNPWGIDYDSKGQLFITACVIPHLWHVIPGGIYHRQGGQHFNPYVYSDIRTITDHSHRSAHGGARIYQSDAFPQDQQGRIFMANIHEHGVLSDVLVRKGSGFTGLHGDDFMMANNAQWVGFSMEIGPDGGLYVLDWHDADICGNDVLNKETGRIFRIMPEKNLATDFNERYSDLSKMNDQQLVALQTSKSDWHVRRARIILQHRAAQGKLEGGTHAALRKIFEVNPNSDYRLRAMWALHVTNGLSRQELVASLSDKDEYVRSWAIQLLCEPGEPSSDVVERFKQMARGDRSAVVRLYLASAMQRMSHATRWDIATALTKHGEDAEDHNLPKMIWYAVEPLVKESPARALELAGESALPMIAQFTARRAVDEGALEVLVAAINKKPKALAFLLEGMRDGLEGSRELTAPPNWKNVYASLKKSNEKIAKISTDIAQQFGDTEVAHQLLQTLKNKSASIDQRRQALHGLVAQQYPSVVNELPSLLENEELRTDAIRAIAAFDRESLGRLLMERYKSFNEVEKQEAIQTLSSRSRYGWMLTQALARQEIPKRDVPVYAARQLLRVVGSGFIEVWGPIEQSTSDEKEYAKYKRLLTDQSIRQANLANGRVLYQRTCGPCHKLYDEGGVIGPDITGSNRANLDYLLFNILDPSGDIQDDYKLVVIATRNGRTYSGNVIAENDRQVTIRVVGQDAVVLNKSEIQSREVTPVSMMPPGLLNGMNETEVVDLIAYLRSASQVPLP